jgi:thiol:disulfide interchange protein DsbC
MFPRAGIGSDSYKKAVSVWCSDDRKAALTRAKSGAKIEEKTCDNPVASEYALGQQVGVTGTPAIFLSDGELVPGYVPPAKLEAMLKQKSPQ